MSKKSINIVKIIFLVVLVIILGAVMMALILFNGKYKNVYFSFTSENEVSLVSSNDYLLDEVKNIKINSKDAFVTFKHSTDDNIKVEIYDKDEDGINLIKSEDTLKINADSSSVCVGICFYNRKIVIYLPNEYAGNIKLISVSGDVTLEPFNNSIIDIKTTSGDVSVKGASDLKVKTVSGELTIKNVKKLDAKSSSGDIECFNVQNVEGSTISGDLEINNLNEKINFSTTSGDIEIDNATLTQDSSLITVSGDVDIENINSLYINVSTVSGEVNIPNNDRNNNIELNIKTTSGDIEIK